MGRSCAAFCTNGGHGFSKDALEAAVVPEMRIPTSGLDVSLLLRARDF